MDMFRVAYTGFVSQVGKLGNHTILGNLQRHHSALFTLRRRFSIQLFGVCSLTLLSSIFREGFKSYKNMLDQRRTAQTFLSATQVEKSVMKEFLRGIEVIEVNEVNSEYEVTFILCMQIRVSEHVL